MMLPKNRGLRLSGATLPAVAGLEDLTQDPSLLPGVFTENTPHPEPTLFLLSLYSRILRDLECSTGCEMALKDATAGSRLPSQLFYLRA